MQRFCTCLLFLACSAVSLVGQPVYEINAKYPVQPLMEPLRIFADPEESYTIEKIVADSSLPFFPRHHFPRLLEAKTVYWGKLQVRTRGDLTGWMLHLEDRYFRSLAWIRGNGRVDVYAFANGQLLFHKKTGGNYRQAERDIPEPYNLNRVYFEIPKDETVTVYVRVKGLTGGFSPFFNLSLRAPDHAYYHPYSNGPEFFRTFLLGMCFIVFLYHVLQYLYLGQSIFLWFSLWVGMCTLTQAMTDAYISEWLLGDLWQHRFTVWMGVANCILFTFWFFGRSFIHSREKFPKLDKVILVYTLALGGEILLMTCSLVWGFSTVIDGRVGWHYQWVIASSLIGFGLAVYIAALKDPFARYFGLGAIIATSAALLGGLWSERLIQLPFDPYGWGIFLQIIAYSFGIAYRQRQLSRNAEAEKMAAQQSKAEMQRLKDLDEIKTRFFANISHEFRTPLSLILGPIQQAQQQNASMANPDLQPIQLPAKSFSIVKNNVLRLQHLVDQLLDLSQIESGFMQLHLTQGGLVRFCRTIVFSFQSMAEQQNISMNTSFPPEIDAAFYDRDKLEKIISNLLSNAFKYTPTGGAVTFAAHADDSHFVIEVSDTGKGIDKEDVKRIFERFYRVEGSEKEGSGIGLALTKELVDLHNGQISVSSTKGQGSTFKVRIPYTLEGLPTGVSATPLVPEAEKSAAPEVFSEHTLLQAPPNDRLAAQNGPVVLLVEDHADLCAFIASILEGQYQLLTAVDGEQGERMAIEHIPDIIVTDVMMPKKDGYALCQSLKTNPKTSHIPIVMLTAKAGQSNKLEGLTQGADAYLTKPFDAAELRLQIRNLIDARRKIWDHFKSSDLTILPDLDLASVDDRFLQQVIQAIKDNLDNELLSVEDLARAVGFSRSQLHRKLKALVDKSANQLITEIRLNEARRLLESKAGSVSEIAYSVGYSNMSYFTKSFREQFGVLPSKVLGTRSNDEHPFIQS